MKTNQSQRSQSHTTGATFNSIGDCGIGAIVLFTFSYYSDKWDCPALECFTSILLYCVHSLAKSPITEQLTWQFGKIWWELAKVHKIWRGFADFLVRFGEIRRNLMRFGAILGGESSDESRKMVTLQTYDYYIANRECNRLICKQIALT